MATRASILFDYMRAINQARKLEGLADDLRRLANSNVESTVNNLSSNWKGEGASEFLKKADKAQQDLRNNADQLDKTANVIRRSAENIKNSELRALEIIEQMSQN